MRENGKTDLFWLRVGRGMLQLGCIQQRQAPRALAHGCQIRGHLPFLSQPDRQDISF